MTVVHVIDVESGNLKSLSNAIKRIGDYEINYIRNVADFDKYDSQIEKLIFPGVGNYGHFMREITSRGLEEPIRKYISSGRALMGICVGLQAFFSTSEESVGVSGLKYIDLALHKFDVNDHPTPGTLKAVPAIGWNNVDDETVPKGQSLYGIDRLSKYYFVHSYAAVIKNAEERQVYETATKKGWDFVYATYGSETFIAAFAFGNLFATQFHPEKSGVAGLKVIKSFLQSQKVAPSSSFQVEANTERTPTGLTRRVIACLDVRSNDHGDLVVTKGDQYNVREKGGEENVRNLGKPIELAVRYYDQGADEITFLNITSFRNSPLKDLPMLEVLSRASEKIFVPLTVGGGIKDMQDPETGEIVPAVKVADMYFKSGADKVSIGSDAVLIAEAYYQNNKKKTGETSIEMISSRFGNQAVVISVDPKRKYLSSPQDTTMQTIEISDPTQYGPNGEKYCYYQVTSQGGRKTHDLGALELCLACEDLGAGEILLNSIDHDGSNKGFNFQLINQIKSNVSIPVIASSGAGVPDHFKDVFEKCNVDAALGAGLFHRGEYTVNDVKKHLQLLKMDVRLDLGETL